MVYMIDIVQGESVVSRQVGALDVAQDVARQVSLETEGEVYVYAGRTHKRAFEPIQTVAGYVRGKAITFSVLDTLGKDSVGTSWSDRLKQYGDDATLEGMARIISKR